MWRTRKCQLGGSVIPSTSSDISVLSLSTHTQFMWFQHIVHQHDHNKLIVRRVRDLMAGGTRASKEPTTVKR